MGWKYTLTGRKRRGAARLAEVLPLQIVDPDVHNLVAGGPDERRRFLDWMAFHVELRYLEHWRRFRRALRQRNAALKENAAQEVLLGWDRELAAAGLSVHEARCRVVERLRPAVCDLGTALLACDIDIEYQRGWGGDRTLAEAISGGIYRDRQLGSTQSGPHRADLRLVYDERQARRLVSRGQQKLLACALILAATEMVQAHLEQPLMLLLDDPAAELDNDSLGRLIGAVVALDCQVVATSLGTGLLRFPAPPRVFHVERGALVPTP